MRKISFLNKLYEDEKIQIVDPSEELKKAYMQRSEESLSSSKALLKIGNLKDSVALAYYSMYHCLLAALFRVGIKCENHSASIILLKELFGIDDTPISKAKAERVDKQYYVDFSVNKEEAEGSVVVAEDFIAEMIEFTEKLGAGEVQELRKKAKKIIGL